MAEVEIIRTELNRKIASFTFDAVEPGLRYSHLDESLTGLQIQHVNRRGKFLLLYLSNDHELIIHLGMTGQLLVSDLEKASPKHTHFESVLRNLTTGAVFKLLFVDPRRFGKVSLTKAGVYKGLLTRLGPEIFSKDHPTQALLRSKKPVKAILLDQHFMAGLGNYLCDEILFDANISPSRPGNTLHPSEIERIVASARKIATNALEKGGLSFSDYVNTDGTLGHFQNHLKVYGRQGQSCYTCSQSLATIKVAGRTTVFCGTCQR